MGSRIALGLFLAVLAAGCGGDPPSPESVVRAWSTAINTDDNEGAAELFAPGAEVIQLGRTITLDSEAEALAFNASLPCSGQILTITEQGDMVTTVFRLEDRETQPCDGPGVEVTARFRVRDGKIVLWRQLPGTVTRPPAGEEA